MTYFNMLLKVVICTDVFPLDLTEILKGRAEFCALSGPLTYGLEKKQQKCSVCRSEITVHT